MRTPAQVETFDISLENREAYIVLNRSYRMLLAIILAALMCEALFLGVAAFRGGPSTPPRMIVLVALGTLASICGVLAYGVFYLYGPGPDQVVVDQDGATFKFRNGRTIVIRWSRPRLRIRISRVVYRDARVPSSQVVAVAIQGINYPHMQLNQSALAAILGVAWSRDLEISDSRLGRPDGGYSDRIWVRGDG